MRKVYNNYYYTYSYEESEARRIVIIMFAGAIGMIFYLFAPNGTHKIITIIIIKIIYTNITAIGFRYVRTRTPPQMHYIIIIIIITRRG